MTSLSQELRVMTRNRERKVFKHVSRYTVTFAQILKEFMYSLISLVF